MNSGGAGFADPITICQTPQFVLHSAYDTWQLDCHLDVGCRTDDCSPQEIAKQKSLRRVSYKKLAARFATISTRTPCTSTRAFSHCQVAFDGWWVGTTSFGVLSPREVFANWYSVAQEIQSSSSSTPRVVRPTASYPTSGFCDL